MVCCSQCAAWKRIAEPWDGEKVGYCRRRAPAPQASGNTEELRMALWLVTLSDDGCLEGVPLPQEKPRPLLDSLDAGG